MIKVSGVWMGVIAIVLGVLVLIFPDIIRVTVGVGLIILGIIALIRK